jgi:2-C-methyl-D-erythritol 2,4-cyclodiphosphate synthase
MAIRVGIGYDSHRFAEGRPCILGGQHIPHDKGLAGHSDADAVAHAVTDAVLGAAGLGDIGKLFPDTDAAWKDADSMRLLAMAMERVRAAGWLVGNVDCVVVAERPRIGPHAAAIRTALAAVLGCVPDVVSIKGKTNETMGFIGRGEGIAVMCTVLLESAP